ncbi:uncharacterized protein ColSpa_02194 [Colletotrichum spaethianum]|uniref:Uncharacterized protein n=1 Tax=Colletotrichum spaethianum TaxID=700344 RepID=A0AA37L512_9PEZI|nr:uncharacterized protein ColSpa_02194 [Colletotrichum spaethianum]GKT42013.1 hypothetical protein ColSpa_02194 [Colletotrichum spaethianum]
MSHPSASNDTHIPFHVASAEYQPGNYSQQRSPQYKISNEPTSSLAEGRGALDDSGHDGGFELIFSSEITASGPPSDTTGSDDTVIDSTIMRRATGTSAVLGSALTQNNMDLHDRVCPLGPLTTYQWIWGQPCPGGFDIKDASSKESMKVHVSHSRVSQATENLEVEYGLVNHPSEAYIAFAGYWADYAAGPAMQDELDQLK